MHPTKLLRLLGERLYGFRVNVIDPLLQLLRSDMEFARVMGLGSVHATTTATLRLLPRLTLGGSDQGHTALTMPR